MENSHHLKYFKVENFKCFESFEMDDIGQFNLIVGDNNAGKTSVLEALLFQEKLADFLGDLALIIEEKNKVKLVDGKMRFYDYRRFFFNTESNENQIRFHLDFKDGRTKEGYKIISKKVNEIIPNSDESKLLELNIAFSFLRNNKKNIENDIFFLYHNNKALEVVSFNERAQGYIPIIYSSFLYAEDLVALFSKVSENINDRNKLTEDLKLFIPNLKEITLSTIFLEQRTDIVVYLVDSNNPLLLSSQGDGAVKLFRILAEINYCENDILRIDEIDNGIHYSRFKEYWKTILNSAKRNKVQLFMTTHSLECLKYFKEALEEMGEDFQKESRLFHLIRTKEDTIKAFNYDYSQFSSNIELENEMRS